MSSVPKTPYKDGKPVCIPHGRHGCAECEKAVWDTFLARLLGPEGDTLRDAAGYPARGKDDSE